ncbi:type III-B CRISPR module-associated protein Cmr5 [Psychrobacter alimentarius]|uniref:type III-B CRISPR module-associated protein Cmr5 n=1 Tax=Psychrobacter alimentarius TaxID=261164 RepID=UPI003FD62285
MKIRTHKYAELAYPLVNDIKGSSVESKYRTLALTFPTMIMQSGLAQAIGFLMAKNKDEHKELLQHMAILLNEVDSKSLHDKIINSSVTEYQLLSREALDASAWLKRYTQALLEKQS